MTFMRPAIVRFSILIVSACCALLGVSVAASAPVNWHHDSYVGVPGIIGATKLETPSGIVRLANGDYAVTQFGTPRVAVVAADGSGIRTQWTGAGGVGPAFTCGNGGCLSDIATDAAGNIYVLVPGQCSVHMLDQTGQQLATFGACGTGNGELTPDGAYGLGVTPAGEVWVADTFGGRIVRFAAATHAALPAWGGFASPSDVAFTADGSARISEPDVLGGGASPQIRHVAADGTQLGVFNVNALTPPSPGVLRIAPRADGFVLAEYDPINQASLASHLRILTAAGTISTILDTGVGYTLPGQVAKPFGIAFDPDGSIVVVDQAGRVQRFHLNGPGPLGSGGTVDVVQPASVAVDDSFGRPYDVDVAPSGQIGVTDDRDNRFRVFSAAGSLVFATPLGSLDTVHGVTAAPDGTWWVTMPFASTNQVVHFDANGAHTDAWPAAGTGSGAGAQQLSDPEATAVDPSGNWLLIADGNNDRVQMLNLTTMTADGSFGVNGYGDGQFNHPKDLAFGPDGRLYVADQWGQRVQAFTRNPPGAGGPTFTFDEVVVGGYGEAPGSFHQINSIAFDPTGRLVVLDQELGRVQWIDVARGEVVDVYGIPGRADGQWFRPSGLAFETGGTFIVADSGNARVERLAYGAPPPTPPSGGGTGGGGGGTVPPPIIDETVPAGTVAQITPIGGSRSVVQMGKAARAWVSTQQPGSLRLIGTVSDAGGGVPTVFVSDLDGVEHRTQPAGGSFATVVNGRWSTTISWSAGARVSGLHTVTFTDAAGNTSTTSFRLMIDNWAPTVVVPPHARVRGGVQFLAIADRGAGSVARRVRVRTPHIGRNRVRVDLVDRVGNVRTRWVTLQRLS